MRNFFSVIFILFFSIPSSFFNFSSYIKINQSTDVNEKEISTTATPEQWLDPWGNRKSISIQENSGVQLTDYQVRIDVANEPGMSGNFSDIRFTQSDGVTLLDFWMEGKFGTNAIFWVKIPHLNANSNTEIFMYFDNIASPLASNPNSTFVFYDDFRYNVGWNDYNNGVAEFDTTTFVSERISTLKKATNCDPSGGWKSLGQNLSEFKLITRETRIADTVTGCAWNRYSIESTSFNGYGVRRLAETNGVNKFGTERRKNGVGSNAVQIDVNQPQDFWYRTELNRCSATTNNLSTAFYDDNRNLIGSAISTDMSYNSFDIVALRGGIDFYIDFFAVANFTCPEPTVTLGPNDFMLSVMPVCPEPVQTNATVYETIENVTITASSCGNDSDITIDIDGSFANDVEYAVGWVDFDQDDIFETMVNFGSCTIAGTGTNCSISSSIPIPNGTLSGNYNIRIVMQYNVAPDDPCSPSNFAYGEAETHEIKVVKDSEAPTAETMPIISNIKCFSEIPAPNILDVVGETDNCNGTVIVTYISDTSDPGCVGIVTRTYQLEDESGNTSDITQSIEIKDDLPPTADPLPNLGPFACYEDLPTPNINLVTGEIDNCGGPVTVSHVSDSPDPGCNWNVTRIYRLTDQCNNYADIIQLIPINDNIAPTAPTLPSIGPFGCYADIPAPDINDVVGESDNCGALVNVTFVSDSTDPGCSGIVTRTYQLQDDCGNTNNVTQTISIEDNVAPTADPLPALGPFACYDDIPTADINEVTGTTDNCTGAVNVTFVSDSADPGCSGSVTRTYQLEDGCSNTSTITQTISIEDNVAPTADPLPALGPFACYDDIPTADINEVTGTTDNCTGAVNVTFVSDSADPGCSGSVTRTYQLEDGCSNTSTITQTISIEDNVAPTADPLPALGPFACYADIPTADINVVTGTTDNCNGAVTVTFVSDSADPGCSGSVTRTYQLEDECSNTSTITQTISIEDNIAPTADPLPALGPFACYDDIPAADINEVTGTTDNCNGAVTVTFVSDSADPGCSGSVTRTYQLEDGCSNTSTITQTISIEDNIAPTADPLPALGPFACYDDIPTADINEVTGTTDNCTGAVTVTFVSDSADPGCSGSVTRTYQLEDGCSNTSTITQTIILNNNISPSFTCPADVTISCEQSETDLTLTGDVIDEVVGCDNTASQAIYSDDKQLHNPCFGEAIIRRTWSLQDNCNNITTCVQVIIVEDNLPPTADPLPALGPFACYADVPTADINEVTGTTDNCTGAVTVTFVSDSANPGCSGSVTRTYQLEDGCSNTSTITQTISIEDNIAPTADPLPVLGPFACYADIPTADINEVTGTTDNCNGAVTVTFVSDSADPGCSGSVTRTYQLEDECNNTSTITQTISIEDNVAPTADPLPALGPFACYDEIPTADINEVTGTTDNCNGAVTVTFVSDSADPGCSGSVTRTYQLEDGCSNTSTITQTISIEDNVAPIADPLNTINVECTTAIPDPDILLITNLSDNCNGTIPATFIEDVYNGGTGAPGNPLTISRSYEIEDACGNTAFINQSIVVEDTELPIAICQDLTLDVMNGETIILTPDDVDNGSYDNCEIENRVLDIISFNCQNEGVNKVMLTITDINGSTATCESIVTVNYVTVVENLTEVICENDTVFIGTNAYTTTGFYQQLLTTTAGCDSIVNLDLDILPKPTVKEIHLAEICSDDVTNISLNDFEAELTTESGTFIWYEDAARTTPLVSVPVVVDVVDGDIYYATFTKTINGCKADAEVQFSVDPTFCPTPLDLIQFTGNANDCAITIEWRSANETNFSHYELERSDNGSVYQPIELIDPVYSQLGIRAYFFKDYEVENGDYYYRLKMVDRDGQFDYSDVINVHANCNEEDIILFELYPNPVWAQKDINITMSSGSGNNPMDIRLFDAAGRLIRYQRVILNEGINHIPFEVKHIASGVYYFHFEGLEYSNSKPFYKD